MILQIQMRVSCCYSALTILLYTDSKYVSNSSQFLHRNVIVDCDFTMEYKYSAFFCGQVVGLD